MYPHELIEQISSQSGRNVAQLIHDNAGVYAFIDGIHAISQTNISCNPAIRVDSPTELDIYLTHGDVFLGYLFTYPHYRGTGTAASLLEAVCEDVKRRGYSRIVTHIRSTNVASLNTFNKCGWSRIGWILTSTNGHLLSTYCLRRAGITILATR